MATTTITTTEVLDAIRGGILDSEIDQIARTARNRKDTIEKRQARSLTQGDKLKFSDGVAPKYLVGKEVTFERMARKKIVVSCPDDPSYGRFQNAQGVTCPMSIIDVS